MRTLVTGSGGFLGSYVCSRLELEGWQVTGAGRPEVEIPSPAFDRLLERVDPELIVHCAGPASVPASLEDPLGDFTGSAGVLAALLDRLARRHREARLVLVSSAAVYGEPASLPATEDHPLAPVSPYGFHRVVCELLLREYAELFGVGSAVLRVFSAYGEGLTRQVLWDICERALRLGEVRLHGTGNESRDFIHARDVAEAVVVAARGAQFEAEPYNVGTGRSTTVAELASHLVAALGVDVPISFTGMARRGDPSAWRADVSRISQLGFRPLVTIEEGARRFADWAAEQLR